MKIVLIEDDIILSLNFQMMLEELGHNLLASCSSIEEAKKILANTKPDVIISDIMLGDELSFALSQWFNIVPTIFMTSFMKESLQEEAMRYPNAMFLVKPFHKLTLKSVLDKLTLDLSDLHELVTEGGIEILTKHRQKKIVPHSTILWLETSGNYTTIITEDKRYTLKISLKKVSENLTPDFVQVHKGYVVNINCINRIDLSQELVNVKGNHIPVGRSFRKILLEAYDKRT